MEQQFGCQGQYTVRLAPLTQLPAVFQVHMWPFCVFARDSEPEPLPRDCAQEMSLCSWVREVAYCRSCRLAFTQQRFPESQTAAAPSPVLSPGPVVVWRVLFGERGGV